MQLQIQEHLISASLTWLSRVEAVISLNEESKQEIQSEITAGANKGYVMQGGYKIIWKCLN